MSLADRLESFRKQRRDSIGEFVDAIGISRRRYWEMRTKGGSLNSEHLVRAASYLGVKPEELMRDPEPPAPPMAVREAPASYLQEIRPELPLAIPVIAEGSAGDDDGIVDYAYWARSKVAGRTIKAVRVTGDCLQPGIHPGNILFVDVDLAPQNGDIVLCLLDGRLAIKRYRVVDNNQWLENQHGRVRFDDCRIQGVVIERSEKVR